jgi:hypothetical protein
MGDHEQVLVHSVSAILRLWRRNIPTIRALLDRRGSLIACSAVGMEVDDSFWSSKVRFRPACPASEGSDYQVDQPTLQMIGGGLRVHFFIPAT